MYYHQKIIYPFLIGTCRHLEDSYELCTNDCYYIFEILELVNKLSGQNRPEVKKFDAKVD